MMGDTLTVVFHFTESTGKIGSPQCARKESGSRVSRPQSPSVCHQFTESESKRARAREKREERGEREEKKKREGAVCTCGVE